MNKPLSILITASLVIMAGGAIERSYQEGVIGQALATPEPAACPVYELTRTADPASVTDALQDAHAGAQRTGCAMLAIVEG